MTDFYGPTVSLVDYSSLHIVHDTHSLGHAQLSPDIAIRYSPSFFEEGSVTKRVSLRSQLRASQGARGPFAHFSRLRARIL